MISTFHIKKQLVCIFLLLSSFSYGQEYSASENKNNSQETTKEKAINSRQLLGSVAIDYYQPLPTGNNFVGNGMKGEGAYSFKIQVFLYKQFFVGFNFGNTYLSVTDPFFTGNYKKTSISNQCFFAGYEFLPFERTRLGLNLGAFGDAHYKNTGFTNNDEFSQTDTGTTTYYEAYLDYEIGSKFSVYFAYSYRNDKMNIKAPENLQANFNKATYHNFGLGIKFHIGNSDMVSRM